MSVRIVQALRAASGGTWDHRLPSRTDWTVLGTVVVLAVLGVGFALGYYVGTSTPG